MYEREEVNRIDKRNFSKENIHSGPVRGSYLQQLRELAHVTRNFYSLPRDVTRSDRLVYPPNWRTSKIGRTTCFVSDALSIANLAFRPPRRRRPICKQRLEEVYGNYRDAIDISRSGSFPFHIAPVKLSTRFAAPYNPTIFSRISDAPLHQLTTILFSRSLEITCSRVRDRQTERERIITDSSIAVERGR